MGAVACPGPPPAHPGTGTHAAGGGDAAVKRALVVIDMTNNYCHPDGEEFLSPAAAAIVPAVAARIESSLVAGMPVFLVRTVCLSETDPMSRRWGHHNRPGEWATGLVDGLAPFPGRAGVSVVDKTGYDAFARTGLADAMRSAGVTGAVLAGVFTDVCVLHSCNGAWDEGFSVRVAAGCVADSGSEPGCGDRALRYAGRYYGATLE